MRLIDADALADALFEKRRNYPQWVADTIENMPDAVVRCKDCHYWSDAGILTECSRLNGMSTDEYFFCAYGKPKDGDGE